MEVFERNAMKKTNKDLVEAISVINELLKYGNHRGVCAFTMSGGSCAKHFNASKRREKQAVKFMIGHGYIPGGKP